ncbi:hypothetical protein NM688_g8821 [Phlebia brevispora]|uniref:Uncharacterized protein n=1 Tax=Phlebia brevispora TaxID=194682 RepID=A0ACC1RR54_9APHY|nr:hypothetical protein NM688_g8821 [Phlebia brevispora]
MDQDALSPTQRVALSQLQALTNGGDADVAISVLDSVGWDVQRAADVVFDSHPSAPLSISRSSSAAAPAMAPDETFEVDDSEQNGLLSGRPNGREFNRVSPSTNVLSYLMRPLRLIIALLALPYTILRAVLRALHVPLPLPPVPLAFSISGLGLNFGLSGRPGLGSRSGPRRQNSRRTLGTASGSASAVNRRPTDGASARVLPDFFIGSYESFARQCGKDSEPRIGCVVLVSEEHDDVAEFKRSTLTDPEFVRLIQENDILVWGGDIRDRDAWSAAQKLQATTYPFVALPRAPTPQRHF